MGLEWSRFLQHHKIIKQPEVRNKRKVLLIKLKLMYVWKVKEENVGNERATGNMHATIVVLCWGYKHSAAGVVDEFQKWRSFPYVYKCVSLKTHDYWQSENEFIWRFVNKMWVMRCGLWQRGLIVYIHPRFLLKRHFGIIRIQLQNTSSYKREIYISEDILPGLTVRGTYTFHFHDREYSAS